MNKKEIKEIESSKQRVVDAIALMDNATFFEYFMGAIQPDDYDDCFTDFGYWECEFAVDEMKRRLSDWLKL